VTLSNYKEIKTRVLFTLLAIFLYRFGSFIPIPGLDSNLIKDVFSKEVANTFGMFNLFSGGAFQRMSIFALNIMPYITASIVMQLLSSVYAPLSELKKEGIFGRVKLNQYVKYLTIVVSIFQSLGVYYALSRLDKNPFFNDNSVFFIFSTCISLVGGTVILMWLGGKINVFGIGNGISILIFTGIVSSLPSSLFQIFDLSRVGVYHWYHLILFLIGFLSILFFVCFFERAVRKIKINHPSINSNRGSASSNELSFLPIKINVSGVIPPIFATSLLTLPAVLLQIFNFQSDSVLSFFYRGSFFYYLLFASLIMFFCYFYSFVVFNCEDVANNLKRSNCFLLGVRPGAFTSQYLKNTINKITLFGSLYLILICIIPEIVTSNFSIPISIGGTGILIIVNVILDLLSQFHSYSYSHKYKNIGKRKKFRIK
jgi:preprotein translocase subunit SecY